MSGLWLPDDHDGGMVKLCTWGAFAEDGAPHVQLLPTTGRGTRFKFASGVRDIASRETAEMVQKFASEFQPKLGHAYLLDTALGSYEYWGANNNGDGFYEADLCSDSDDHGYRSFMKHAHVFQHHRNKDPSKAMGKIVLATYNRAMRRVELIEELDMQKAAAHLDQWEKTGSLPTSMGCKVAYDVCSECGHKARRPAHYCEHAKLAMRRILTSGRQVHVRNPKPRFFDQSHVVIPADKIAGVMQKVAFVSFGGAMRHPDAAVPSAVLALSEFGEQESDVSATPAEKTASLHGSISTYDQVPRSEPQALTGGLDAADWSLLKVAIDLEPALPVELLEEMSAFPLEKTCSTMAHLGIVPTPSEWQFLVLCDTGKSKVAHELHSSGVCFQLDPSIDVDLDGADGLVAPGNVSTELAGKLAAWMPHRSCRPEFLSSRLELAKTASAERVVAPWEIRQEAPGMGATMLALAASYEVARRILRNDEVLLKGLREVTGTHPAVAAALVAAGAAGIMTLGESATVPTQIANGPHGQYTKISSLLSELDRMEKDGSVKGVWKETPTAVKTVLAPFAAGYTASAYYRGKQMQGKPTGSFENVVADHPLLSGVAAVAGATKARQLYRRVKATK